DGVVLSGQGHGRRLAAAQGMRAAVARAADRRNARPAADLAGRTIRSEGLLAARAARIADRSRAPPCRSSARRDPPASPGLAQPPMDAAAPVVRSGRPADAATTDRGSPARLTAASAHSLPLADRFDRPE